VDINFTDNSDDSVSAKSNTAASISSAHPALYGVVAQGASSSHPATTAAAGQAASNLVTLGASKQQTGGVSRGYQ